MTEHSPHPDDLLPWYVNDTLDETQRQQVEAHLQHCPVCQQEVSLLRTMRSQIKDTTEAPPTKFSWQRLRRDMRSTDSARQQWHQRWLPSLATAAALVIVLQGVLLFNYAGNEQYRLAGYDQPGTLLQIKFNPDATEKDIRLTLQQVSAEIVAGPSASGVYRIRLSDSDRAPKQQAMIDVLKANTKVIDYIQRD